MHLLYVSCFELTVNKYTEYSQGSEVFRRFEYVVDISIIFLLIFLMVFIVEILADCRWHNVSYGHNKDYGNKNYVRVSENWKSVHEQVQWRITNIVRIFVKYIMQK